MKVKEYIVAGIMLLCASCSQFSDAHDSPQLQAAFALDTLISFFSK